ncbi:MAG: general stress protein [Cyanophyceae cyanobacterium]
MLTNEIRHAVGVFPTRQDAEYALRELQDAGFNMDQVSVIAQDAGRQGDIAGAGVSKTPEEQAEGGAGAGATAGAATGGLLGLIGGLGILAIPGVGVAAEAGIVLANTLLGSGIGAAGGGLVGALIGWGVPEERANYYNERLGAGEYIVLLEGTDAEIRSAEAILNNRGIRDWGIYGTPGATSDRSTII